MQSKVSPEAQLAFLIHDVSRLFRRRFDQRAAGSRTTRAQWHVLAHLRRNEGVNQATLAEQLDMEPITLSRHIDRMEAAGLVERRRDPADRRAHRLHLGAAAEPVLTEMRAVGTALLAESMDGLTAAEVEQLTIALGHMRANLTGRAAQAATGGPLAGPDESNNTAGHPPGYAGRAVREPAE